MEQLAEMIAKNSAGGDNPRRVLARKIETNFDPLASIVIRFALPVPNPGYARSFVLSCLIPASPANELGPLQCVIEYTM